MVHPRINAITIYERLSGTYYSRAVGTIPTIVPGQWYHLVVITEGSTIKAYWNGQFIVSWTDGTPWLAGKVGFRQCLSRNVRWDNMLALTSGPVGQVIAYDDFYPFGMQMEQRSYNAGSADARYKYTGKERDAETTYDYFGARYYDPRVGRWMSVDPLADKYRTLSPFVYTADNPVKLVDSDGKEILIHGSASFQRTALVALQKLTNDKLVLRQGVILISKLGGQNSEKSLTYGTNLIRDLNRKSQDAKTVTILRSDFGNAAPSKSAEDARTPGKGSDSEVQWNPNSTQGGTDVNGNTERPSEIGLAHELLHAQDAAHGTVDPEISDEVDPDNQLVEVLLPRSEVKVRRAENAIRKEQGLPERANPERLE